ncbi:protein of unknown function (plasmid) [Cupriavidus taiwanensis]|nr:protein of unknown function [Cupriavidus taiwanensis]
MCLGFGFRFREAGCSVFVCFFEVNNLTNKQRK